jgi:chloramphenicol-sensitive protein RarD
MRADWLVYVYAVQVGRVVEASLGCFVTALVNVVLGVAVLRESLTRLQRVAVALAAAGVAVLVARTGAFPWVSAALAGSFGLYGLLRKRAAVDSVGGLFGETRPHPGRYGRSRCDGAIGRPPARPFAPPDGPLPGRRGPAYG